MGIFGGNNAGNQAGMMSLLLNQIAQTEGVNSLTEGYDRARNDLVKDYYQPSYDAAFGNNGSLNMLINALGLNGQQGKDTALNAYQNYNPGYGAAMDAGVKALDRSAAARGMLNSGNQAMALTKYGQDLSNQNYGNWISQIGGLTQLGQSAAAGETGRQNTLANLDYGLGQGKANVYLNTNQNAANAIGNGIMADQAANNQGQANLFGGILGGLKLGGSLLGLL